MDFDRTENSANESWRISGLTVRDFFLFVVVPVAAFWLRTGVFWQSLWYDEVLTARVSAVPYMDSLRELAAHNTWHPPLYYWLNHLVLLVTDQDWANRILALAFGLAVLPLVFLFAKRLVGKEVACLTVLLLTISPMHVQCSRDAREYTLFLLVSLWALERLWAALEENKFHQWAAFAVFTALSMYSSFFAFMAIFSQGLFLLGYQFLLICRQRRLSWALLGSPAKFAACIAVSLLAYAPVLPIMLSRLGGNVSATVVKNPAVTLSWAFFRMLLAKFGCGLGAPLWAVGIALAIGLAVTVWKKPELFLLGITYIAGSLAPFFLILRFSHEQIFSPRYIVFVLPAFLILVAVGLFTVADLVVAVGVRMVKSAARWRGAIALATACVVAVVIHLFAIGGMFVPMNENLRETTQFIARYQEDGDAVILQLSYSEYMFAYYRKEQFQVIPIKDDDTAALKQVCDRFKRVWYVGYWGCPTERFGNELERLGFLNIFDQAAQGIRLDLLDKGVSPREKKEAFLAWRLKALKEFRYHPRMDILVAWAYAENGNQAARDEHMNRALDSYWWLSKTDPWLTTTEGSARMGALKDYGELLDMNGHCAEARTVLKKALSLGPDRSYMMYSLAISEMNCGDFAQAAILFDKVLTLEKKAPYWMLLKAAEAFAGSQQYERAITICREGYQTLHARKEAHAPLLGIRRAEYIARFVDEKRAINVCKEIMEAYPDYAHAYGLCAALEFRGGDAKTARETLWAGLKKAPEDYELLTFKSNLESYSAQPPQAPK